MLDLAIGFGKLSNLLQFLVLALCSALWVYHSLKKQSRFILIPFILINALVFARWGWLTGICHDTSEHFHCAWMISQDLIPYKDFWQHHPPLLWLILAPIFKILKPTALIFDAARIVSALLFAVIALIGWKVAKEVWREKARLSIYLLMFFGISVFGQFLLFRPDLFMDIFLLLGIYFSLKIPQKRILPAFLAGVAFALAASFNIKQYFLYFLPIIVVFLEKDRFRIVKFLAYCVGVVVGGLPTLFYLIKQDILTDFFFWVLIFNRQRLELSVFFPVAIGFMGIGGAYLLLRRFHDFKDTKALILFIAFCLSSLSSLTRHVFFYPFYIAFWFILCAILSSGCNIIELLGKIPSLIKKSIIASLFFSFLTLPNIMNMISHDETNFSEHKKVVTKLMQYCQEGDTCQVLLPLHPIFNHDASRLYSYWQYLLSNRIPALKIDINSKNLAQAIIRARPAVIEYKFTTYRYGGQIFILDLLLKKLVTLGDYKKIQSFLKEHYTVKRIGAHRYYIRNDKLEK
jgi:hypothetical protein